MGDVVPGGPSAPHLSSRAKKDATAQDDRGTYANPGRRYTA